MQRRHHPSTPLERHGQVNWRIPPPPHRESVNKPNNGKPSCVVFVHKRKGWGSLGNEESAPLSLEQAKWLARNFTPKLFQRYRVNVYLKDTGASQARKQTRGW